MTNSSQRFVFGLTIRMVALCLVLAACNISVPGVGTQPTNPANPALTAAVQTLEALPTQAQATSTTEAASPSPTITAAVASNTATNTAIVLPTTAIPPNTPVPPSPTAICNKAQFVSDVSVPDGTIYSPGFNFTKTWRLKNVGTCTWTSSYSLVFDHGQKMGPSGGEPSPVALPSSVAPGQTVDVSITLTTPTLPGNYQTDFRLRSNAGTLFGVGAGQGTFWVKITVLPGTSYP